MRTELREWESSMSRHPTSYSDCLDLQLITDYQPKISLINFKECGDEER